MPSNIEKITASEIKDSRGNPTLSVTVFAEQHSGTFSVPSGASTGIHEAMELRDKDGKGVEDAISKVNGVIASALIGIDALSQRGVDEIMVKLDGTLNKKSLGGNSTIGVSIACAKLAANVSGLETFQYLRKLSDIQPNQSSPYLYMNLINGGKHAANSLAFQEYHIVPMVTNPEEAVQIGIKIQDSLKQIILSNLGEESLVLGDEGGFAPKITDVRTPLVYLREAIKMNNLQDKVRLALDVAATSFFKDGLYYIGGKPVTKDSLMLLYNALIQEFDLLSIEDPFHEEDFEGFRELKELHPELIVVGDDLTVTNTILLRKAITNKSINGIIIKPNQVGTLSETIDTIKLAYDNGTKFIVSHRSGETMDDFIADLAYAYGAFGLKSGSPLKEERMVKYQRLIKIVQIK